MRTFIDRSSGTKLRHIKKNQKQSPLLGKIGVTQFSFKENTGDGNLNNPNAMLIPDLFNQNDGKELVVKAECVIMQSKFSQVKNKSSHLLRLCLVYILSINQQ